MLSALGNIALRWSAALIGTVFGWAAAAGLFTAAIGWSRDSILAATYIGLFCLTAWVFVGLPLAVLSLRFPTVSSASVGIVLAGLSGISIVVIALRPTSIDVGLALFAGGGFVAAAVTMAVYMLLSWLIVGVGGRSLNPGAMAGRQSIRLLIPTLFISGALAGVVALPLSSSLLRGLQSRRTVTAMMTWEPFVEDATPGANGVRLRFVDAPSYYLIEYVPGLLEHLQGSRQRTIPVEFITHADHRGRFNGFSVVKIDGLPYRPDPRYNARAGQGGAPPPERSRHPLDVFENVFE